MTAPVTADLCVIGAGSGGAGRKIVPPTSTQASTAPWTPADIFTPVCIAGYSIPVSSAGAGSVTSAISAKPAALSAPITRITRS